MQRLLALPRHVVLHMLPLGTSLPCRLVATVMLAVVSGASMAAAVGPVAEDAAAGVARQAVVTPGG